MLHQIAQEFLHVIWSLGASPKSAQSEQNHLPQVPPEDDLILEMLL